MAECHPVGFQWVMEAKARGATVIHVDPRFTRTSALADLHVPIRAGTDIAFLGGLINHVLTNEQYFRDYVVALHQRGHARQRGLPRHRGPRRPVLRLRRRSSAPTTPTTWQYEGVRGRGRVGRARRASTRTQRRRARATAAAPRRVARLRRRRARRRRARRATRRCSTRAACSRCSSGTSPATRRRWSSRSAASRRSCSPRSADALTANSGRDRTTAFVYARRLDPAHRRRAVHPRRVDPAAAARQHRPARRRHHGAARARQHPGLHRHPDAVQPAARLHPDAARRTRTRTSTTSSRPRRADEGLLGEHARLHGQPAQGVVGRRRDRRTTTSASTTCRGSPASHSTYETVMAQLDGDVQGLLPARREPGGRLGQRQDAAARHGQPRLAGRPRLLADRERHVVEGRPGDRDRRDAHRGHRHRGVLPARRRAHREGRHASPTPSGCCSGTTRRSSRRATRAATCGSSTTSAGCIREKLAGSTDEMDRPVLDLTWDYPTEGPLRRADRRGGAAPRSTAGTPTASRCRPTPS